MDIIRKLAVKSYNKELSRLINTVQKWDEEKVAIFLIYSVWLRSILQIEGHINALKHLDPQKSDTDLDPELHAYPIMLGDFTNATNFFDKKGENSKSIVLRLWIHTLRSIIRPELNNEIKILWEIILKSKKYWDEKLDFIYNEDIQSGIEKQFVENTKDLSKKILDCLPPKQIYH